MFKIVLTKHQWQRVSEILGNLGLLSIASIVLPFIFDKPNPSGVFLGITFSAILWYHSIKLAKKY